MMRACGRCGRRSPFAYCARCRAVRAEGQRQRQRREREADGPRESTAHVERLLAQAEARRRQIGRLALTEAECWGGAGVSAVYSEAP